MFSSLGNLVVDDEAALLFVDFERGSTATGSSAAALDPTAAGMADEDGRTGRRVRNSSAAGSWAPVTGGERARPLAGRPTVDVTASRIRRLRGVRPPSPTDTELQDDQPGHDGRGRSKFVDAWNHLLEHLEQSMNAARRG